MAIGTVFLAPEGAAVEVGHKGGKLLICPMVRDPDLSMRNDVVLPEDTDNTLLLAPGRWVVRPARARYAAYRDLQWWGALGLPHTAQVLAAVAREAECRRTEEKYRPPLQPRDPRFGCLMPA